jgi:hypothetical protein
MSSLYDKYATLLIRDIPNDDLRLLVHKFLLQASLDMGQEIKESQEALIIDRIVGFIKDEFNHLPLCLIASAFKKGALGKYGPGRLVPRTIYGWMAEMSLSYSMQKSHEHEEIDDKYKWDGLQRYPVGKAINKKIDWLRSGAIILDDWDKISLKELADFIYKGMTCSPDVFGIKHRI